MDHPPVIIPSHPTMTHNTPHSSAMSPIQLFREVKGESVSRGRSSLFKKVLHFFNQKTLVGSLIARRDRERLKKGKALLHVVGGKPVQCVEVISLPRATGRCEPAQGEEGGYKSGRAQTSTHSITPTPRTQTSSPPPTMAAAGSLKNSEITLCGVGFGSEIREAHSVVTTSHRLDEIFENLLEECDDAERVLSVHEGIEKGELEHASADDWMPVVGRYVGLLRAVLTQASSILTKEELGFKLRMLVRADGKFMKALAMAEEKAYQSVEAGSVGSKRASSEPSASCPKLPRRSVSSTSLASEAMSNYEENPDEAAGSIKPAPIAEGDSRPAAGIDVEKEKGVTFESARKSLADYQHLIKQCAVRSEDLDSDGDEEKADRQGLRFADYPEGVGRAMAIGPIIPKTQEFLVIGPVPMGDAQAAILNKKMSNLTKAVSDGDKSSKALTAFSPLEIQKTFGPGTGSSHRCLA